MSKPKKLFWVEFRANGAKRVGYRHRLAGKGGKFSTLAAAKSRAESVIRDYPDAEVTVFEAEVNWVEVPLSNRERAQA